MCPEWFSLPILVTHVRLSGTWFSGQVVGTVNNQATTLAFQDARFLTRRVLADRVSMANEKVQNLSGN